MSDNSYLRSRPVPIPTTPAYDGARPLHGGWNGQKPRGTKAQTSSSYMYVVFGLLIVFGVIGLAYSFTSSSPPEPVPNIVMKTDMDGFELALHHYESNPNLLLYFVAGPHPSYPEKSWCPDCNLVTPVFYDIMEQRGNHTIIEVDVGGPWQWKDPNHELRHHEDFMLRGVPTLIKWVEDEGVVKKMDRSLETSRTREDVEYYVNTFLDTE